MVRLQGEVMAVKKKSKAERRVKNLLALRDAVIKDFSDAQIAYDNELEFKTREGERVEPVNALFALSSLFKMAQKCL